MADIKPNVQAEKLTPLKEQPINAQESLKIKSEQSADTERAHYLERARENVINEIKQMENMAPTTIGPVVGISVPQAKQQKQIENILAEGLSDIYLNLTSEKRREFKRVGEETARKINKLLTKTKVNIGEIIKLIIKWLSIIPGINKYFLEQEAKIKADEIIKMKR